MKKWEVDYKGYKIRVENSWSKGESLYVDSKLQDQKIGFALRSRLYGGIKFNDNTKEYIKVSMGGWFSIQCRIFVDNKLVFPTTET